MAGRIALVCALLYCAQISFGQPIGVGNSCGNAFNNLAFTNNNAIVNNNAIANSIGFANNNAIANNAIANNIALANSPFAGNIGVPIAGIGANNYAELAITGDMPVTGMTKINGNMPVIGYITFEGSIPTGGVVTVANGNCGCN